MGAIGDPSVPDHVSLWGLVLPIRAAARPAGRTCGPRGCSTGIPCPLAGPRPGRRRHAASCARTPRASTRASAAGCTGPARPRSASRRASSRARASSACVRYAFELAGRAPRRRHERDQVERLAVRLRALGRGRRARSPRSIPDIRYERVLVDALAARMVRDPGVASTSSSRRTSSATSSPTSPPRIQGGMGMAASANLAPGVEHSRPVRAGARLGARHRRPRDRESVRVRSGARR